MPLLELVISKSASFEVLPKKDEEKKRIATAKFYLVSVLKISRL